MSPRVLAVLVAAACLACDRWPWKEEPPAGPLIRATVVTIRTTIQPGNRVIQHDLVIAGNRARSTAERDLWRIFDTKNETVTFVDDVARTARTRPLASIIEERRKALKAPIAPYYPRVGLTRDGSERRLQGTMTALALIEVGGYRRELWIGRHRAIPPRLFAMMHASEPPSSALAPMMRDADEALLASEGFPMLDLTRVVAGEEQRTIQRAVVSIVRRDVALSLVTQPHDYADLTPKAK